jgi:tetratricopeptide (TPR) repeat protein
VIIFFPSSRYAAPVMPAMIIFCALGVESLLGDGQACPPKPWRRRNARPAARIAGCALCLILLVLLNLPLQLPTDAIDYSAELHTNIGVGLQTRGRTEEAVEHYRRALRLNHQYADAHRFLGTAYRAMQKTDLARRSFERTLQIRPDHDQAMQDLAVLLFHEGKAEKSVRLLRQALELNPDNRHTMKNLAIGLLHLRQTEEANQWLRKSGSVDKRGRLRLP